MQISLITYNIKNMMSNGENKKGQNEMKTYKVTHAQMKSSIKHVCTDEAGNVIGKRSSKSRKYEAALIVAGTLEYHAKVAEAELESYSNYLAKYQEVVACGSFEEAANKGLIDTKGNRAKWARERWDKGEYQGYVDSYQKSVDETKATIARHKRGEWNKEEIESTKPAVYSWHTTKELAEKKANAWRNFGFKVVAIATA